MFVLYCIALHCIALHCILLCDVYYSASHRIEWIAWIEKAK
jgi:hypothetical protein